MEFLNYHHLLYFFLVAREGGLAPAAKILRLSPSTLSTQIRTFEERLGEKLLERRGRRLVLTEAGSVAYRYAERIHGLGKELTHALEGQPASVAPRLDVGVVDAFPRVLAARVLLSVLDLRPTPQLHVKRASFAELLHALDAHSVEFVLSDAPVPPGAAARAFNHELFESGVSFVAAPAVARSLTGSAPACLEGAPLLVPAEGSPLARSIARWLREHGVEPRVVAEVDDSALMKAFAARGLGVAATPTLTEAEVCERWNLSVVARTTAVRERFYLVSSERRIRHPLVARLIAAAKAAGAEPAPRAITPS